MIKIHPQFVTDTEGKMVSIILPIKEFQDIMEELDDREDIKLYEEAKKGPQEFIDAKQAFEEIEESRKGKDV